jgi:hypothetical protein
MRLNFASQWQYPAPISIPPGTHPHDIAMSPRQISIAALGI